MVFYLILRVEYILLDSEHANFSREVIPKTLLPGTKLYRAIGVDNWPNGAYWSYDLSKGLQRWREDYAVKEAWNSNGYYVEHVVGPEGLPAWEDTTATQTFEDDAQAPDWLYTGGETQLYLPNSDELIPDALTKIPTYWEE